MSSEESQSIRHPDIHEQRTAAAEHRIADHLRSHPHNFSPVFKELRQLRHLEGEHFHDDLIAINRHLEEQHVLPHTRIVEKHRDFAAVDTDTAPRKADVAAPAPAYSKESENFMAAVRHDIAANNHRHVGHRYEGFASMPPEYSRGPSHRTENNSAAAPSKTGFAQALLEKLGLPITPENLAFLDAWQKAEGGSADNPFNTSQRWGNSNRFNGDGVQRYASIEDGVNATARTLQYGHYRGIMAALRQGDNAHGAAIALAQTPWGTGSSVMKMV